MTRMPILLRSSCEAGDEHLPISNEPNLNRPKRMRLMEPVEFIEREV